MPQKNNESESAFKNWINLDLLKKISSAISKVHPEFEQKKFLSLAKDLSSLELKARVKRISLQLRKQLPQDYSQALEVLIASLQQKSLKGFDLWPYTDYIQTYGLHDPKASLQALHTLTQVFTSEFAVRPFLIKHQDLTLRFLLKCTTDKNVHVRRWASEGSRPRLPWGEKLTAFVKDPSLTLPILEKLKNDPELYVRKSVANHLNDITKDHPQVVIKLLKQWQKQASAQELKNIHWITRHSLRSLIKAGHPEALALVGVDSKIKVKVSPVTLQKKKLRLNEKLEFSFVVTLNEKKAHNLVIDYVIHHQKNNNKTSAKTFKLKNVTLKPGQSLQVTKKHSLKVITTRQYYPGLHKLEIQINGKIYTSSEWHLKII